MADDRELAGFGRLLQAEVADRALGDLEGGEFSENAFVDIVAEHLAEIGMLENPVVCFHEGRVGQGIVRLNGYAVADDGERVDLLIALYGGGGEPRTVGSTDIARAGAQAARALTSALRSSHQSMEEASDEYAMILRLAELLEAGLVEARVLILTNGIASARELERARVGEVDVSFEVYDLRRLMRTMQGAQVRDIIDVDLADMGLEPIPCVEMPAAAGEYAAYLAIFPGEALYRLYEAYGPRLLEYNVRAFLQATGKVNRGIRDTLRNEPQHFMAYNNGISCTVDAIWTAAGPKGMVITGFRGLQVVNGGQTTASIHRARKRDRLDLSRVHVPAKITALPAENVEAMVPQISRFANTQNVIQEADFSSNEPFHVALERLSKSVWVPGERSRWFYERSRGQYQTACAMEGTTPARLRVFRERTPPSQKFTKTDLARFINSWSRLPHVVSTGAQKNFVSFMRTLRDARGGRWEPDEAYYRGAIAQAIIWLAAQRVVRQEGFPAYRVNIGTYLVSYISHRTGGRLDLEQVWRNQALSPELEAVMRSWSHAINREIQLSAAGRNVTEWCKNEDCWSRIRQLDIALQGSPPEWGDGQSASVGEAPAATRDEHAAVARCMTLSSETWFALHLWGRRTGHLAEWQAGIAHTLSLYAGGGWQKAPTIKQARQGVRMLEIAAEQDFDPSQQQAA